MICRWRDILAWLRHCLPGRPTQVENTAKRQVTLAEMGAARSDLIEDIVREVYRRHYIHYPHATINAFLVGSLKPGMLAYKVIHHTIHEAFGLKIHNESLPPSVGATQGKEL